MAFLFNWQLCQGPFWSYWPWKGRGNAYYPFLHHEGPAASTFAVILIPPVKLLYKLCQLCRMYVQVQIIISSGLRGNLAHTFTWIFLYLLADLQGKWWQVISSVLSPPLSSVMKENEISCHFFASTPGLIYLLLLANNYVDIRNICTHVQKNTNIFLWTYILLCHPVSSLPIIFGNLILSWWLRVIEDPPAAFIITVNSSYMIHDNSVSQNTLKIYAYMQLRSIKSSIIGP